MRLLFATFTTAFVASLCLTPIVRMLAKRWHIVDHPDEHRKLHREPTPLGGGAAVLMAFLIAIAVVLTFSGSQRAQIATNASFFIGLVTASIVISIVGLIDDRFGLRGRQKLFGQFIAAGIVTASGLMIDNVQVFGINIEMGPVAVPFTLFFLLGAINALNLIDGLDGLATGVGIIVSVATCVMATLAGHPVEAFLALGIAGALTGFLFYNSPPASIFLGDAGSMLIGLVIGTLAIRGSLKGPTTIMLAAPTAILAIPIFDVSMAILRRRLTGRSIYTTDRSHLHHTLMERGFSNRKTVAIIGLLCTLTAGGAALSVYMHSESLAFAAIIAVCAVLVATRLFGYQECSLLFRRLRGLGISLVPTLKKDRHVPVELKTRFRGNREWEELWQTLTEFADRFDLIDVQLNVNLPAIGEEYHATWHRKGRVGEDDLWQSDIPLVANHVTVGRLRIAGVSNECGVCSWMGDIIAGLGPFETHMLELLEDSTKQQVADTGHDATNIASHAVELSPKFETNNSAVGLLEPPEHDERSD